MREERQEPRTTVGEGTKAGRRARLPRAPRHNRRRLLSLYRNVGVDSTLLQQHTGWQPVGALLERLRTKAEGQILDINPMIHNPMIHLGPHHGETND